MALFNRLVSLTEEARRAYKEMVCALEQEQAEEALKNVKKVPHHMGHSRNPSAASAISFCSVISEPISEVNEKEYETNWRTMVENSDALEPLENEFNRTSANKDAEGSADGAPAASQITSSSSSCKEEGRVEDGLERASQQSTETGSLDGSCRGPTTSYSSITSTSSITLVPGALGEDDEEDEDEEEDEEDEYTPEPILVEVPPLSSMIETWVNTTLENLQLSGKTHINEEEEEEEEGGEGEGKEEEEEEDIRGVSDEEDELESSVKDKQMEKNSE